MEIKIRKLSETAKIPSRGSDEAAGYDLFADIPEPVDILPHTTAMISTGVAMAIPAGYFGGIFARSGLSAKEGLRRQTVPVWWTPITGDRSRWRCTMTGRKCAACFLRRRLRSLW